MPKKVTNIDFVKRAIKVHNNTYCYEQVNYVHSHKKVIIVCPGHGEFLQSPNNHLKGRGCPICAESKVPQKSTKEEFTKKASLVHSNKYSYDKVSYDGNKTKVIITCPTCGDFKQRPDHHLIGKGCPSCAKYGFNPSKPAVLYYLSINNGQAYKIGITNNTVKRRFDNESADIRIIKQWKYLLGKHAYEKEQELLKKYSEFRYSGDPLLENGNTELFNEDVLHLNIFIKDINYD